MTPLASEWELLAIGKCLTDVCCYFVVVVVVVVVVVLVVLVVVSGTRTCMYIEIFVLRSALTWYHL